MLSIWHLNPILVAIWARWIAPLRVEVIGSNYSEVIYFLEVFSAYMLCRKNADMMPTDFFSPENIVWLHTGRLQNIQYC